MFWVSVKGAGYPLHPSVSLSLPLPCVTVCHHISTGVYHTAVMLPIWAGYHYCTLPKISHYFWLFFTVMIILGMWDRNTNYEQVMGNFFWTRINEQFMQENNAHGNDGYRFHCKPLHNISQFYNWEEVYLLDGMNWIFNILYYIQLKMHIFLYFSQLTIRIHLKNCGIIFHSLKSKKYHFPHRTSDKWPQ